MVPNYTIPLYHQTITDMKTTIELPFQKVSNPVDYSQIEKLRSFDNFICSESNSQLMKRLDAQDAEDAIEALQSGNTVEIK